MLPQQVNTKGNISQGYRRWGDIDIIEIIENREKKLE